MARLLPAPSELTLVVKQHCLVAIRRPASSTTPPRLPSWFNRGLDTQVLLAEVRETSRKPDELYDMIERILGGKGKGRKVELFGREHNLRDGWCVLSSRTYAVSLSRADERVCHARWTLGNQLGDRDQVFEPEVVANFAESCVETALLPSCGTGAKA